MSLQDTHIQLGAIQGAFGIKGWLKVFSFCRPKEQILDYSTWELKSSTGTASYELQDGKVHGNGIVAKLHSINDRTQAETILRAEIWVAREHMPALADNEYYWFQLEGLNVCTLEGESLGKVKSMMETGANDVMVVIDADKKEILIPYVHEQVIKQVDLDKKLITVDWHKDY